MSSGCLRGDPSTLALVGAGIAAKRLKSVKITVEVSTNSSIRCFCLACVSLVLTFCNAFQLPPGLTSAPFVELENECVLRLGPAALILPVCSQGVLSLSLYIKLP